MRLDPKDRLLGAVPGTKATTFEVAIGKGNPRSVDGTAFPRLKRGAKGQKVIKRGTPESIGLPAS